MSAGSDGHRAERDSLGEVRVPLKALYGAQTARAVANFPISGRPVAAGLVRALAEVKAGCALANGELGLLPPTVARAIREAALEVASGAHAGEFPVDVYQTGSGTSTNMNVNEVVANRANELLSGGPLGVWRPVHPNDHVNLGQSSNDVFPTAVHLAAITSLETETRPALRALAAELCARARELDGVVKLGRTHLMDATPVRVGQELGSWARAVERAEELLGRASEGLLEVPLGGTATGSGLNRHPELPARAAAAIHARTGVRLVPASPAFEAQSFRIGIAAASGALRAAAGALAQIAGDLRLLSSGPHGGLGELALPALQPGSSIMPGKVNPVIPEAVRMVWARIVGNDATVGVASALGELELNVLTPVLGEALLDSCHLLAGAARVLAEKCVSGLRADEKRCRELVEGSSALATALAPRLGYERAAEVAKRAAKEGRTVREAARELGLLSEEELERLLDPRRLSEPGYAGEGTSERP